MRRVLGKVVGVFIIALAFWALPSKAEAIPLCGEPPEDIEDYSDGCTIDGLLFDQFLVIASPGSPNDVDAMNSWVDGSTVWFELNPNLFTGDDVFLYFRVSTLDGSASIVGVDLQNWGTAGSHITEDVCTISWVDNGDCAPGQHLASLGAGGTGGFDDAFFSGQSEIFVVKDIGVPSTGDGHISRFTQSFHTSVPDGGSTLALLGLGLLGLRSLRHRFPRR